MKKEELGSVKNFIDSLNAKLKEIKSSIKEGDESNFKKLKRESLDLTKKIDEKLIH